MFGVRKMARVKGAEEDLLKDASESLAELTGLDQEWISVVLKHRKKQFRKLVRENACGKTVEQESERQAGSSALQQAYRTERAQLRKTRIAGVKKVLERERQLANLEESRIDTFVAALAEPNPLEAEDYVPTDSTSNEQEDQILLERLKEVERRAQELAEARKVKAAKGRTPVRSALEGLSPCTTISNSLLQHASSPEELLILLREAQKK